MFSKSQSPGISSGVEFFQLPKSIWRGWRGGVGTAPPKNHVTPQPCTAVIFFSGFWRLSMKLLLFPGQFYKKWLKVAGTDFSLCFKIGTSSSARLSNNRHNFGQLPVLDSFLDCCHSSCWMPVMLKFWPVHYPFVRHYIIRYARLEIREKCPLPVISWMTIARMARFPRKSFWTESLTPLLTTKLQCL